MASNPVSSFPTAATAMNPNRLELRQTPTIPTSFVEELDFMSFIGLTSSDDAKKELEWLESWNPSKVLPVDDGARVTEAGRKSNPTVDLPTTNVKNLRTTAIESAVEGGNMNISSPLPRILDAAQFPSLPGMPSGWAESSHAGRVDSPVRLVDMTSDPEGSTSANDSTTPPTSSDEFDGLPIGPQTIHEADQWCKNFLAGITPTTGIRKRKATTEPSASVPPPKKARVIKVSRAHLTGFPSMSEPLPAGLLHEDIIKRYPNHLRGELLLDIAENWTPKQIVETSGQPQLKSNTIVKRIHAAKEARDGFRVRRKPRTAHPSSTASPTDVDDRSPPAPRGELESEASRQFRLTQTDIRDIIEEWDADFFTTLADRDRKGMADIDRAMIERAALERERRLTMRHDGAGSQEE